MITFSICLCIRVLIGWKLIVILQELSENVSLTIFFSLHENENIMFPRLARSCVISFILAFFIQTSGLAYYAFKILS